MFSHADRVVDAAMSSDIRIKTITVSSMLDSHPQGQKRSTFISATADVGSMSIAEFKVAQLRIGLEVAAAAIQNAACRMEISASEAQERVSQIKENYAGLIKKVEENALKPGSEAEPPF